MTAEEFLKDKPLAGNDNFGGYKITYSYLVKLLNEYAEIKTTEVTHKYLPE